MQKCGISIVVVCVLPKDKAPVRFWYPASILCAHVAQLVEQWYRKPEVVGSIPTAGLFI